MSYLDRIADFIRGHQSEIVERWVELSREDESFTWARSLTKHEFEDGIPQVLVSLASFLCAPDHQSATEISMDDVKDHGHQRWKLGFDLNGLLRDWGTLREVLHEVVREYFEKTEPEPLAKRNFAHHRVAHYFTEASCASAERYDEVRRSEAVSVFYDLERMRAHFERLLQVRAELLHEASHDIRSGLTAISGVSGLIGEDPGGEQTEGLGDIIDESISSVVKILDSFMELNRLDSGKESVELEAFSLSKHLESLGQSFQRVAEEKGLTLTVGGEADIIVNSDASKLRRIFQNLLVNALKYTQKGTVSLTWRQHEAQYCEVRVADTGPGFQPKKTSPVVSELNDAGANGGPENTEDGSGNCGGLGVLSYEGEGIGLTIVKRLCTLLNIPIDLQSERGKGSTFILQIPFDSEKSG